MGGWARCSLRVRTREPARPARVDGLSPERTLAPPPSRPVRPAARRARLRMSAIRLSAYSRTLDLHSIPAGWESGWHHREARDPCGRACGRIERRGRGLRAGGTPCEVCMRHGSAGGATCGGRLGLGATEGHQRGCARHAHGRRLGRLIDNITLGNEIQDSRLCEMRAFAERSTCGGKAGGPNLESAA